MCINETNTGHPSIVSLLLVWALIASLLLNVGQAYAAYHRSRKRSSESASVSSIGVQSQCTYTRWHKSARFHFLPSGKKTSLERLRLTACAEKSRLQCCALQALEACQVINAPTQPICLVFIFSGLRVKPKDSLLTAATMAYCYMA
jgi:hypothetical protein